MSATVGKEILQLAIGRVKHDQNNRKTDQEIAETAESIDTVGQLTPILVRQIGEVKSGPEKGQAIFRVVSGHRRLGAFKLLAAKDEKRAEKYATINAIVITGEDVDEKYARLTENTARVNLTITELGWSAYELKTVYGQKVARIAAKIGKSREHVSNCLGVVEKVHKRILDAYDAGTTTLTAADLFQLKVMNEEEQLATFEDRQEPAPLVPGAPAPDPNKPKLPSKKKLEATFLYLDGLIRRTGAQEGALQLLSWQLKGGEPPFPIPVPEPVQAPAEAVPAN